MSPRPIASILVPAVVALAAAAAGPARAAWSPPQVVAAAQPSIEGLRVATGGDGSVLLSWQFFAPTRSGGAVAARSTDGRWAPQHTVGLTTVRAGRRRVTGAGEGISSIAGFGRDGVVALTTNGAAPRTTLDWWRGTTGGTLRRGGPLPEPPWYPGLVAAFADGAAVAAWTTTRPRRGAGTNLRPRVAVLATRRGATAAFSPPRRISPLPPPPPYGNGRGPKLSATALTIAVGGSRMIAAAWQRTGAVEARASTDRGRTWGPVRRLGPSERHPRIGLAISARGDLVVVWTTRAAAAGGRSLVTRIARGTARGPVRTRVLERTPPLAAVPPAVADRYGATARAGFAGEDPLVAWQGADDGRVVARSAFLLIAGEQRATAAAPAGQATVLEDLVALPAIGSAALAVRSVGALGEPLGGYVLRANPGAGFGPASELPLAAVRSLRIAAARDGWLVAAVTHDADGDRVRATVGG